jgi:hypothetical protein
MWFKINSNPPFEIPDTIFQHYRIRSDEYRISEIIEEASKNIDFSGKSMYTAFHMVCDVSIESQWKKFIELWGEYPTEMHHVLRNKRGKNDDLESAVPPRLAELLPPQTYDWREKIESIQTITLLYETMRKYQFYNRCNAVENYLASYIQFTFEEADKIEKDVFNTR